MTVRLVIPGKPLSVNDAYRGRRFATGELQAFHDLVRMRVHQAKLPAIGPIEGPVAVRAWFYFANNQPDLDNAMKPLLDGLEKAKVYRNDRQVKRIEMDYLVDAEEPRIEVEIVELSGAESAGKAEG